jgi:VanZ family protein
MIRFLKKYFHHILFSISWSVIILILLALPGSMLPEENAIKIPNLDKLVHIGLFGGFVLLWSIYFSVKEFSQKKLLIIFFRIFIIGCIYGGAMEFVQKYFIPSRDFEIGDILADVAGAAIAYGISNIYLSSEK